MLLAGRVTGSARACLLALLLMVTAACTSDSPTPTEQPTSQSTKPSSTPDVTATEAAAAEPPAPPAEVDEDTVAGASAFARHYWATANYATETGDTGTLHRLGTNDCSACADLEDGIARVYESQERMRGGLAEVQDVSPRPGDPVAGLITKVLLRQTAGRVVDLEGETVSSFAATDPFLIDMVLVWREGAWAVNEWGSADAP